MAHRRRKRSPRKEISKLVLKWFLKRMVWSISCIVENAEYSTLQSNSKVPFLVVFISFYFVRFFPMWMEVSGNEFTPYGIPVLHKNRKAERNDSLALWFCSQLFSSLAIKQLFRVLDNSCTRQSSFVSKNILSGIVMSLDICLSGKKWFLYNFLKIPKTTNIGTQFSLSIVFQ